ncbi:MAG: hypothetical protein H6670_01170 [Anaerolineaceae bacterium]|nr:hypothetical protein [Anaerolineaceae bacterium]
MIDASRPEHPVIAICPKSRLFHFGFLVELILIIAFTLLVVAAWLCGWGQTLAGQFFILFLIALSLWGLLNFFYRSPTFWIHHDGITVLLPFRRVFVKWEQIAKVKFYGEVDIAFYQLSPISRLLAVLYLRRRPFIMIGSQRKNYLIFREKVLANIPERVHRLGDNKKRK